MFTVQLKNVYGDSLLVQRSCFQIKLELTCSNYGVVGPLAFEVYSIKFQMNYSATSIKGGGGGGVEHLEDSKATRLRHR